MEGQKRRGNWCSAREQVPPMVTSWGRHGSNTDGNQKNQLPPSCNPTKLQLPDTGDHSYWGSRMWRMWW